MFWNWFLFILYSLGTVCSISNMSKATKTGDKIFRMLAATGMFMLTVMYSNTMLVMMLEGMA